MKGQPVISIIGGTVWGNRGAESMLVTVIGKFREMFPDAKFHIFSYYPKKDRELVNAADITILSAKPLSLATRHFLGALALRCLRGLGMKAPKGNFLRIAAALAESDLLLDIGGITFSDGREKYLPFNILTIWPAMLLKVPVIKMAQAVGPFRRPLNRLCAKLFLTRCRQIFARGEKSAEFLAELGYPDDRFETVADIAFHFKPQYSLSEENSERVEALIARIGKERDQGKQVIVISPSVLVDEESRRKGLDYPARFFDAMKTLGAESCFFVVMPNATRESSKKSHNNDLLVINRMQALAAGGALKPEFKTSVDWVAFDINSAAIRAIIGMGDVLVTSRYHAMISALSLGVPVAVIGWGHKYRETMAYFDLMDYSLDFSDPKVQLADVIKALLAEGRAVREKINSHLPAVKAMSGIQFSYTERVLS